MDLKPLKDAVNLFTRRQKQSISKTQQIIDQLIQELQQSISKLQTDDDDDDQDDPTTILHNLRQRFDDTNPISQIELKHKALKKSLDKYTTTVENTFHPNISNAYRHEEMDSHTVNQIILTHLYRNNQFGLGDLFAKESGQTDNFSVSVIRSQFLEVYTILQSIENDEFEPAFNWIAENRERLTENGSNELDLKLKLHGLQFTSILQKNPNGRNEALQYAREFLTQFSSTHKIEIKKLMGCLLWAGRLDQSPYSDLLSSIKSENIAGELMRAYGFPDKCHLVTTIRTGNQSLPVLLKVMNTAMKGKEEEWQTVKEIPFPVDLDRDLYFHSIFICPVSGEEKRRNNRVIMLLCGHVILYDSLKIMCRYGRGYPVKCPCCRLSTPDHQSILDIYF